MKATGIIIIEKSANGFLARESNSDEVSAKEMFTFEKQESLYKWIGSYFAVLERQGIGRTPPVQQHTNLTGDPNQAPRPS